MVDSVVTFLLENLPGLLLQEHNLPNEVKEQIKLLHDQLGILNAFLKVSEGKRKEHAIVREIVSQIRDAVHEAEDIIDIYIYDLNRQTLKCWGNLVRHINQSKMLHDVTFKIEKLKLRIEEIKRNQQEYGMEFGQVNDEDAKAAADLNKHRREVEEDDVVGFEDNSQEVINKLTGSSRQHEIISIIGMGGLGKTTLARKVYMNNRVKRYFNHCAWTDVSNDYETNQLLLNLLQQLGPDSCQIFQEKSTEDLMIALRNILERKRYLVVLDDIWKPEAWHDIKDAFPDDQNGSRILITSRSNEVANELSASSLYQYHLPFLSKEKSWELFSKRVFREKKCPSDLEDLGRKMAENCDGLPLSIVVLAGLMSKMGRSKAQWTLVTGNEIWYLFRQKSQCSEILALSYHYLPRHLKPCFLYLGLFPEDFEISARHLFRLWVAEGLIQEDTGTKQPEDVAELYLQELIDRSLVQIARRRTDGGVKTCRIHDLLRALCIDESKRDKFYEIYTGNTISSLATPRRLSLYYRSSSNFSSSHSSGTDHSSVRSLICFTQDRFSQSKNDLKSLFKVMKLLRVLDLGLMDAVLFIPKSVRFIPKSLSQMDAVRFIPKSMRKLIHLRYLRIDFVFFLGHMQKRVFRNSELTLANHICNLRNLETLHLRRLGVTLFLPTKIKFLKRLRHLLSSGPVRFPGLDEPLDNLQTLSMVSLEDHMGSLFSTAKFPNLKKLGLYYEDDCNWTPQQFWPTIQSLSNLRTLKVIGTSKLPISTGCFPLTLTKLTLARLFSLESHVMEVLGAIPNLEILKLSSSELISNVFCNIDCKSGEFKSLNVFHMRRMDCINWNLATGAMPRLQSLVIVGCQALNMLPQELWSLDDLRDVRVMWPSKPLGDSLQKLKMKDGCKLTIVN